jgi:hypothetical protein
LAVPALLLWGCAGSAEPSTGDKGVAATDRTTSAPLTAPPALPVLPVPGGPYSIGVRELGWTGGPAQLRAWYPARPGSGEGAPPYLSPTLVSEFGASTVAADGIRVSASVNATPRSDLGPLPVAVFVPVASLGSLSTILMQELASHGFLVILAEPAHDLPEATAAEIDHELTRLDAIVAELTASRDAGLIGAADPARIAVGGHSAGGSIAFEAALVDPRIRAVFDLDGALVRRASTDPVQVPALVVVTSLGLGGHRDVFPDTFTVLASTPSAVVVGLDGADHFDPLDAPAVAAAFPATAAGWPLGPVGPTVSQSTAELVRRFLEAVLSGVGEVPSAASIAQSVPAATATADYLQLD